MQRTSVSQLQPFAAMLLLISFLIVPIHSAFYKLLLPMLLDVRKHLHVEWDPASGTFKVKLQTQKEVEEWKSVGQQVRN